MSEADDLRRRAGNGDTDAMYELGSLGWALEDPDEAAEWLERAAGFGHVGAINQLGVTAHENDDSHTARTWHEKAAELGDLRAMNLLAVLAFESRDEREERRWYEAMADHGDPVAMVLLGCLDVTAGEDAAARAWFDAAQACAAANGDGEWFEPVFRYVRAAGEHARLDAPTELDLAKQVEAGDSSALWRLVEANLRYAVSLTNAWSDDRSDFLGLLETAVLGLKRSIKAFDWRRAGREPELSPWANWWVQQVVQRAAGGKVVLPLDDEIERDLRIDRAERQLLDELGRPPTKDEIAEVAGVAAAKVPNDLGTAGTSASESLALMVFLGKLAQKAGLEARARGWFDQASVLGSPDAEEALSRLAEPPRADPA